MCISLVPATWNNNIHALDAWLRRCNVEDAGAMMIKEVRKVKLGGVTVRLLNKAQVDEAFLDKIFSKSGLDNQKLLFILDTKDGFGCKKNEWRGVTLPSDVFSDSKDYQAGYNAAKNVTIIREVDLFRRDMDTIDLLQKDEWDAVVYIPKITAERWKDFKPYFAFVLGHEFEHVKVIRENLEFHMCATWLYDYNCNIFQEAGTDCKSKKKWKFPLELHCNKQGRKLAIDLFGKEEFDNSLASLMPLETKEHQEYLAFIRKLESEPYKDNIWESICCDIRNDYNEKLRKAAHKIWRKHKSNGIEAASQFDLQKFIPLS